MDLERLRHRGPDSRGAWHSPDRRCWLGHTRLAIIDLSEAGAQPMRDEQTGNVIVFNGEIYNHRALRDELKGAPWRGESDTETLLAAYQEWGSAMLPRLKGMFAFVIFNGATGELFAARDRLGIKPLYFRRSDDALQIASEIRSLSDSGHEDIAPAALATYLRYGAFSEDQMPFENLEALAAGHYLTVGADPMARGTKLRFVQACYWPARSSMRATKADPAEAVRSLLERSVREHLLADVPVASLLSGGIDSSILTALAARNSATPLQTFSVGFAEAGFDETAIAAEVAQRHGTTHRRIELTEPELLEMVQTAVSLLDIPSVDAINTYIVCRKIAESGVKVALSGLGGDELFGGYPSFTDVPKMAVLAMLPRVLRKLARHCGEVGRRLAELPGRDIFELTRWRRGFWTEAMLEEAGLPRSTPSLVTPPALPDAFAQISWTELTGYMRQMLLRDADQMSMAVSIELRVPFLDHELVEYVLALPASEKRRYAGVKGLLVEACRDLLPERVYRRRKMGFALPMAQWMRGPLAGFVECGLAETAARGLIPAGMIRRLEEEFRGGTLHWTRLWSVVVLGHYLRAQKSRGLPAASATPQLQEAGV
ncbi:MAG TPA: asparagine synthase (glutamine-hydrolyzing) [Chthoniobacteraceae bacterium]|jgi:asparagine synthase (glutamine-hydrolysing)|nr:asparagine synthase (glutamine-hydrolyzing) [Chthoniobacteraceae bacterium]